MRDYERPTPKRAPRPRMKLSRGADGRLHSVESEGGIDNIWAEQKRLRLKQAIEDDKRRAERKLQRKAKLAHFIKKATTIPKLKDIKPKQLVSKVRFAKLKPLKVASVKSAAKKLQKKHVAGLVAAVVLVFSVAGFMSYGSQKNGGAEDPKGAKGVLDAADKGPEFVATLPVGKSVDDLGGWGRVSPPDKEPVYAFVDAIGSVQVRVSQQPLPESFKEDLANSLANLAKQFAATKTIQVDESTVYIGTSEKGPQSVILSRKSLLVLIKSDKTVSDDQWAAYIAALK